MALYLIQNDKLKLIKTKPFRLERDIQKLCEQNLKEIFNLDFVSSEFGNQQLQNSKTKYSGYFKGKEANLSKNISKIRPRR